MEKYTCVKCQTEFESEWAGFFKEAICDNCIKKDKEKSDKVLDLTYKLHPEWKGNGIEHP